MKHYAAKILLFGEHILMQGASALATTLPRFSGCWAFAEWMDASEKQFRLHEWADYLASMPAIDADTFKADLNKGLFFDANIPTGYGLGSSGALCAAVYDQYACDKIGLDKPLRFSELRHTLAEMERFFHGSSSGIDPLICYLNHPLYLLPDGRLELVHLPPLSGVQLFLLDSGIPRQTGPLVRQFKARCEDPGFLDMMKQQLLYPSDQAVQAWIHGQPEAFVQAFTAVSQFQFSLLPDMIPPTVQALWQAGLQERQYYLKLCGAGGGGVFLGMTHDFEPVRQSFHKAGFNTFEVS